ncbi:MAG: DUF523 and DUF1722 domain-containing protein [Thermodesulfobacteriota bacterium]|nr:DUF523 and DUF1722 domain-containing protein [Thermodesulfobacteriota bacterium]
MTDEIKLGISSCLLGHKVRYDGGHKLDHFLSDTLGQYVKYVPVCPEVECGFSVPREPFHLEGGWESPRLVTVRTKEDFTDRMTVWAEERAKQLGKENLCGFIFKSKSPSSGMERVKVYNENGVPEKKGRGIFADIFIKHFPRTPVEEDGRLHDLRLRENFVERIFTLKLWRETLSMEITIGNLVNFHTTQKLLLLSHSPKHYREMGKLVARGKEMHVNDLYEQYEGLLTEALQLKSTVKKNTNVLQHIMGYFKRQLSPDEKQELLEIINRYYDGFVPLIVPITIVNHYVRKYQQSYLMQQTYLNPHPIALQLRNHV